MCVPAARSAGRRNATRASVADAPCSVPWAPLQADILDHRQEQIKAEEVKLRSLVLQIERLEGELGKAGDEVKSLKEQNTQQAQRLDDASALLQASAASAQPALQRLEVSWRSVRGRR